MNEVTRIISAIQAGDPKAPEKLLPLVYQELRTLAACRLALEAPGHTLQATELVHEAFLRLVDSDSPQKWDGRRHFFAAASEAMRRILVEAARREKRLRHGGNRKRVPLIETALPDNEQDDDLLMIDEELYALGQVDAQASQLVKLRYFSGLTMAECAQLLGMSERSAHRLWAFAKAWLYRRLHPS